MDGGLVLPNATFVGKSQQLIFEVIRTQLMIRRLRMCVYCIALMWSRLAEFASNPHD